jgi:23S rRNA (adenine1618-N6)-methyltransferase
MSDQRKKTKPAINNKNATAPKSGSKLHPRNQHQAHYDFDRLIAADSGFDAGLNTNALSNFIQVNPSGERSIDFADEQAVKALNRALLKDQYGVKDWDIPAANLCPPVPGRADYIHYLADLLSASNKGKLPKPANLQVLDIGTGANGIYPLIGASAYHWQFVAADINRESLDNLQKILAANLHLADKITLRLQADEQAIFRNVIGEDDWFDLSMCNPPFHASLAEAEQGTQRKWQNLGRIAEQEKTQLNFGGAGAELWCRGGELAFIQNMIQESLLFSTRCFWFTCLVSKSGNLPAINAALKQAKVTQSKTIEMQQGQKQSRFVAWTFLNPIQQAAWAKMRW